MVNDKWKRISEHSVKRKQLETQLLSTIKSSVSEIEYQFWFELFYVLRVDFQEHYILLLVKSSVHADWIFIKYTDLLVESLREITGEEYSIDIDVFDEDISY